MAPVRLGIEYYAYLIMKKIKCIMCNIKCDIKTGVSYLASLNLIKSLENRRVLYCSLLYSSTELFSVFRNFKKSFAFSKTIWTSRVSLPELPLENLNYIEENNGVNLTANMIFASRSYKKRL